MINYRKKILITTSTLLLAGQLQISTATTEDTGTCSNYISTFENNAQLTAPDGISIDSIRQCQTLCDQFALIASDGGYSSSTCANDFASMDYLVRYDAITTNSASSNVSSTQLGSSAPQSYSSTVPSQPAASPVVATSQSTSTINNAPPPPTTTQEKKQAKTSIRWL